MKDLDEFKDEEIPDDSIKIPIDTYRDPIKKMFITQMDARVCQPPTQPNCGENAFKVFDYDDPTAPFIPVHPRCRCTYDMIYEDDTREASFKTAAIMAIVGRDLEAPIQAIKIINDTYY